MKLLAVVHKELTDFLCRRSVWERHVEEGFSSGPAGFSRWLFLLWQPGPARSDPAVHQPAKLSVVFSEPGQSEPPGAGHLVCVGESDNVTNASLEQSGSGVS